MKKQMIVWVMVCLITVFAAGTAYAAPSFEEGDSQATAPEAPSPDEMMIKSIMLAADKFLAAAPDNGYYRYDVKDLKMKVDSKAMDFVVIDVRPAKAFAMEHIPVAINVPLPMLIGQLGMIPTDKTVYVVCAVDSNSSFATAVLRMLGYEAYMVPGGEGAWKSNGYPVEASAAQAPDRQTRSY